MLFTEHINYYKVYMMWW